MSMIGKLGNLESRFGKGFLKQGLEATDEAKVAIKAMKDSVKTEKFSAEKLIGEPSEDCFNKGYMQTEAFWKDPHNKQVMGRLKHEIREAAKHRHPWYVGMLRFNIDSDSVKDGTSKYIDIMKKASQAE